MRSLLKYLLLLVPCVLALWTPYYNTLDPRFAGIPFFYWYVLALIPGSVIFILAAWKVDSK
jgi:Protein of unknown function (DUF3311)